MNKGFRSRQQGVVLIEAIVGIVIFLIGILAMIALQAVAISAQNDAQYRVEAANMANRILSEISVNVARTNNGVTPASLDAFAHQPDGTNCNFSGSASTQAAVTDWVTALTSDSSSTRLPGATAAMQQILVTTGTFNQVTITVCWQTAADAVPRRHTLVSYIN